MENLSIEAKGVINDLLGKGYTPFDIKVAMEYSGFLKEAGISQELSEEIHFFLSEQRI